MSLREGLIYRPAPALVRRLAQLAQTAVDAFCDDAFAEDPDGDAAIQKIQELTGNRDYDRLYFHQLSGHSSVAAFAAGAAGGVPQPVADLERHEIVDLIARISDPKDEGASRYYLEFLSNCFPYAEVSDIIFWPDRERSDEEMADEILLRRQLFQTGGAAAVVGHVRSLAEAVLANPDAPLWARKWAGGILPNKRGR